MTDFTLDPASMTKLDNAVTECVNSLMKSEAERCFRKDVLDRMKEELDIKPADFNALVKERFNDSISEKIAKLEVVVELNDALNENRRKQKLKVTAPTGEPEDE